MCLVNSSYQQTLEIRLHASGCCTALLFLCIERDPRLLRVLQGKRHIFLICLLLIDATSSLEKQQCPVNAEIVMCRSLEQSCDTENSSRTLAYRR